VLITSCVTNHGNCDATDRCSIKEPLQRVNESILGVLSTVTIAQLSEDKPEAGLVELKGIDRLAVVR
jgi:DNA-binding IscR family transcriptional regulator